MPFRLLYPRKPEVPSSTLVPSVCCLPLIVLSKETPEARMLRTVKGFGAAPSPYMQIYGSRRYRLWWNRAQKVAKETKQKAKILGHPSRGCSANNFGQVAFSAVGWAKQLKIPISMTPFLATASGLSLCFFSLLEQTIKPYPEIIILFLPICTSLAPPSCAGQKSALGSGGEWERSWQ